MVRTFLSALLTLMVAAVALLVVASLLIPAIGSRAASLTGLSVFAQDRCEVALTEGRSVDLEPGQVRRLLAKSLAGQGGRAVSDSGEVVLAGQLDASTPAAVHCQYRPPAGLGEQQLEANGLTQRANRLDAAVERQFGQIPDGGYAPGGINAGHGPVSRHYEGLAIDYFFRPYSDPAQRAQGWRVANWLAAHAERLDIAVLIFDDMIWSSRRSAEGWRDYNHPQGATDPINLHLDHIHVDVIGG